MAAIEIPAWLYLSIWAIISLIFLKLGFNAIDRTDLSTSVSPLAISLLKHSSAIALCHSSHYAFLYRPNLKLNQDRYYIWLVNALNPILFFGSSAMGTWYYFYCGLVNVVAIVKERSATVVLQESIGLQTDFVVKLSMYFIQDYKKFYPTSVMLIAIYTSAIWASIFDDEMMLQAALEKENPVVWKPGESSTEYSVGLVCAVFMEKENASLLRKMIYKRRKMIRFAIGMVCTVLFQNFFRLTSFDHVMAFLYLAVAWLGNLALLRPKGDLGIFNFLLGNVIVGCTVSQFGLQGTTWLALGASLVLYGLRLKLETVSLVTRGDHETQLVLL